MRIFYCAVFLNAVTQTEERQMQKKKELNVFFGMNIKSWEMLRKYELMSSILKLPTLPESPNKDFPTENCPKISRQKMVRTDNYSSPKHSPKLNFLGGYSAEGASFLVLNMENTTHAIPLVFESRREITGNKSY